MIICFVLIWKENILISIVMHTTSKIDLAQGDLGELRPALHSTRYQHHELCTSPSCNGKKDFIWLLVGVGVAEVVTSLPVEWIRMIEKDFW